MTVRRRRKIRTSTAILLVLSACSGVDSGQIEGLWLLDSVAVDGVFLDLQPGLSSQNELGVPAWFAFDRSGTFEGAGPCNDISGSYDFDGTTVVGIDAVQSASACSTLEVPVEEFMSLENLVFNALSGVDVHFSSDIRMQWQGENAIVTFRRQP